jgi:membrane protease YdiL (CAAX protease family)
MRLKSPTVLFVLVAFGVPWVGWSLVRALGLTDPSPLRVALLYTGDFCSVGGIVAMYARSGRTGVTDLLKRCVAFRVSAVWWLIAISLPFLISAVAFVLVGASSSGVGAIDVRAFSGYLAPAVLMAFTTGPLGEELGWRGYLTPRLLETTNALVASLVVGFLWAIWHVPLYLDSVFSSLADSLTFIAGIMLTSVIMTAILLHTRGSVLVAVVYHWLSNVTSGVVDDLFVDIDGGDLGLASLGVEAVVVIILVVALGRDLTRRGHDIRYQAGALGGPSSAGA